MCLSVRNSLPFAIFLYFDPPHRPFIRPHFAFGSFFPPTVGAAARAKRKMPKQIIYRFVIISLDPFILQKRSVNCEPKKEKYSLNSNELFHFHPAFKATLDGFSPPLLAAHCFLFAPLFFQPNSAVLLYFAEEVRERGTRAQDGKSHALLL